MSFFDDLSSSVSSGWNSFTDKVTNLFVSSAPVAQVAAPKKPTASVQPSKPATAVVIAQPQQTKSFWDSVGGFMDGLQTVAGKVVTSISTAQQLKTAVELEKLKNKAVLSLAQQAPLSAQAGLPNTSDFVNDPAGARASVLPAILSGQFAGNGGIVLAIGAAALVYFAVKK